MFPSGEHLEFTIEFNIRVLKMQIIFSKSGIFGKKHEFSDIKSGCEN